MDCKSKVRLDGSKLLGCTMLHLHNSLHFVHLCPGRRGRAILAQGCEIPRTKSLSLVVLTPTMPIPNLYLRPVKEEGSYELRGRIHETTTSRVVVITLCRSVFNTTMTISSQSASVLTRFTEFVGRGTMIYFPPLRRLLLPAIIILTLIVFYRSSLRVPTFPPLVLHSSPTPPEGLHRSISGLKNQPLPVFNSSSIYLSPPKQYFYSETSGRNRTTYASPSLNPAFDILFKCPVEPNRYTGHIRLPNIVQNISQTPLGAKADHRVFWNPTVISLPYWSKNQYLLVSRIVTDGNHQENVLCEANICYVGSGEDARPGELPCTEDDLLHLGPAGGMRCVTPPFTLSVPPTPAEHCGGKFGTYVDIPGFHDPRIFWSGRGEPLMMVNTQYLNPLSRIILLQVTSILIDPGTPASVSGSSTSALCTRLSHRSCPPPPPDPRLVLSNPTPPLLNSLAIHLRLARPSKRIGCFSSPRRVNRTFTMTFPRHTPGAHSRNYSAAGSPRRT